MPKTRTTRKQKTQEAKDWVKLLSPSVTHIKYDMKTKSLSFRLQIEPEPQVRQTQNSGRYLPGPIKYNGWKHACALVLKKAMKDAGLESALPLTGWLRLTAKFYVGTNRRLRTADYSNYLKALEDMINTCARGVEPDFPGSQPALPIWEDDRFVAEIGLGGKYPALTGLGYADVLIESINVNMSFPVKKKPP